MWRQADSNTMNLKPKTEYGWVVEDNNVRIIWDSQFFSINQGKGSCFTKRLQMYNRLYIQLADAVAEGRKKNVAKGVSA